jgi:hypothetical protein
MASSSASDNVDAVEKLSMELATVKSRAVSKIRALTMQVQQLEAKLSRSASADVESSTSGASSEGDKDDKERFVKVAAEDAQLTALRRRESELHEREEALVAREQLLRTRELELHQRDELPSGGAGGASLDRADTLTVGDLLRSLRGIHDGLQDACSRSQAV